MKGTKPTAFRVRFVSSLLASLGIAVYLLLLLKLWNLEEPSKWHTLLCLASVTSVGIVFIHYARALGVIRSKSLWILAFLGKILVSLLITKYSWMLPLDNLQRAEGDVDQRAYDFQGQRLAESNLASAAIEMAVRGDTKAMFWYVGAIYYVFGVSTLYVSLINCLWSLGAFLAVSGILTTLDNRTQWDAIRWGMLFPELAFYDAVPGKEAITVGAIYFLLFCVLFMRKKPQPLLWLGMSLAVGILGWVRGASVIATAVILLLFWVADRRVSALKATVVVAVIAAIAVYATPIGTLTPDRRVSLAEDNLNHNESEDPARRGVLRLLSAKSVPEFLLKTPVRAIVFLYGPYPRIVPDLERLTYLSSDVGVGIQELYQKASAFALLISTPIMIKLFLARNDRSTHLSRFLMIAVIVMVLAGTGNLLIHLRYRTQVDPALCATALAGYRYGGTMRYASLWYSLLTMGSIAYYILQIGS